MTSIADNPDQESVMPTVELLDAVRRAMLDLLAAAPAGTGSLRVRAADVEVAVDVSAGPVTSPAPAYPADRPPAAPPDGANPAAEPLAGHAVTSPSVGTFYTAPEPGAEPFVRVGDLVVAGQQIAIVEAMKLMLPVEADRAGRVVTVLRQDEQPVEYGEPLILLETL